MEKSGRQKKQMKILLLDPGDISFPSLRKALSYLSFSLADILLYLSLNFVAGSSTSYGREVFCFKLI